MLVLFAPEFSDYSYYCYYYEKRNRKNARSELFTAIQTSTFLWLFPFGFSLVEKKFQFDEPFTLYNVYKILYCTPNIPTNIFLIRRFLLITVIMNVFFSLCSFSLDMTYRNHNTNCSFSYFHHADTIRTSTTKSTQFECLEFSTF